MRLSQVRPIVKELQRRGYKKTPFGTYKKVFRFSDVPHLKRHYTVTIEALALFEGDYNEVLDKIHATCMNELAKEETRRRVT